MIATLPPLGINIDDFPAVKNHLLTFGYDRLVQAGKPLAGGGKSRSKTSYAWFEVQNTCAYHAEFLREKLIWIQLVDKGRFAFDDTGMFVEASAFLLTGSHTKALCPLLNSTLVQWFMKQTAPTSGMGTLQWKKAYVEPIPLARDPKLLTTLSWFLDDLLSSVDKKNTSQIERQIDEVVFKAYGLTPVQISYLRGE